MLIALLLPNFHLLLNASLIECSPIDILWHLSGKYRKLMTILVERD